jgi:hypothetical protein
MRAIRSAPKRRPRYGELKTPRCGAPRLAIPITQLQRCAMAAEHARELGVSEEDQAKMGIGAGGESDRLIGSLGCGRKYE